MWGKEYHKKNGHSYTDLFPTHYGYNGKRFDPKVGLYDYGFRDYKPEVSRWTTVDPILAGKNWYAYVENDPVNWVDPLGLMPEVPGDGKPHVPDLSPNTVVTGSIVISTTTVEIDPGIEVTTEVKAVGSIGNSPEMGKVSAGAYTTALETFVTDGEVTQRRAGNADEEIEIDIDLEIETIKSNGEREAIRTRNGSGRNEATIPVPDGSTVTGGQAEIMVDGETIKLWF